MLKFRDITDNLDLVNRCLDGGQAIDGLRYNTEVATTQGRVRAAFMGDEIVGGYVMILKGPFRVFKQVEIFSGQSHAASAKPDSVMEIGAVWLHPDVKSKSQSAWLWLDILKTVILSGRKYVIYGINLDRVGLVKFYRGMNPEIMWEGETAGFNMKTHPRLALEKIHVFNAIKYAIINAPGRLFRPMPRGIIRIVAERTKPSN